MTAMLLTMLGAMAVEVVGPSTCPTPGDVAAELARVANTSGGGGESPGDNGARKLTAEIQRVSASSARPGPSVGESHLLITLSMPGGKLLAQRGLPASGSCADLAAAAAVVITTWEGSLRPDLGPDLPRSSASTPWFEVKPQAPVRAPMMPMMPATTAQASVVRPGTPAPQVAQGPPPRKPVAVAATAVSNDRRTTTQPPTETWPIEVGAAGLAMAAAGAWTPGMQLDTSIGAFRWGLAPRLAGSIEAPHEQSLGPTPGKTLWSRNTLAVGLRQRNIFGPVAIDGQAHVAGAWVRVSGSGFDDNFASSGWDLGAGVGLRVAWIRGWLAPWFAPFVGIAGSLWAKQTVVEVTGNGASATLPRYDALLALGVSVGRFR